MQFYHQTTRATSDSCSKLGRTPAYFFPRFFCSESTEHLPTPLEGDIVVINVRCWTHLRHMCPRVKRCCMVCFVTRVQHYVGRTCTVLLHFFTRRFSPLFFLWGEFFFFWGGGEFAVKEFTRRAPRYTRLILLSRIGS